MKGGGVGDLVCPYVLHTPAWLLLESFVYSMLRCASCNAYGLTAFLPGKGRLVDEKYDYV